jgi:tetratricopeptide (TPR) repeat protein
MSRKARHRRSSAPVDSAGAKSVSSLFKRALALQEQGKLAKAEAAYRRVLESTPGHLDARNNLGNIFRDSGDQEAAMACYQKVLAINPDYALAHYNMANVLRKQGKLEEAAAGYRRSLELNPDYSLACNNLGVTLRDLRRLDEAAPWLYRAVSLDPQFALAHLNLGNLLRDQGNLAGAEAAFRQAIAVAPRYMDARCNLGVVLRKQDRFAEAMDCYEAARKIDPNHPRVQFGIADTLRKQSKLELSVAAYRRAIELDPGNPDIHNNMGNSLRLLERMNEAQACYQRAMDLDPDHPDATMNFAIEQPFPPDHPNFARLEAQLEHPATNEFMRTQLIFALARGYDVAGRHDDAMAFFARGNALKAKTSRFDRQEHREWLKRIRGFFTQARTEMGAVRTGQVPVFLLGQSRSGKTLAESLLKQDPRVFGGGERFFFSDAMHDIRREQGIEETFPECFPRFDEAMTTDLGARYMASMGKLSKAPFLLNTLPGHYLHLGWILACLPTARVIYCRREPLDQCLRIYFKLYSDENPHAYTFENIAAYHDGYRSLMDHWQSLYGERILEVDYEDTVRRPQETAGRLFAHLGIDVDTATIRADFNAREIGHWRHYKAHLGPLQAALAGLIV